MFFDAHFALCKPLTTLCKPQLRRSRATGRGSLSTAHESAASSDPTHGIIMLSYARRGSLNTKPGRADGHRQPARCETGFGLPPSNVAAVILGTTKDNA